MPKRTGSSLKCNFDNLFYDLCFLLILITCVCVVVVVWGGGGFKKFPYLFSYSLLFYS